MLYHPEKLHRKKTTKSLRFQRHRTSRLKRAITADLLIQLSLYLERLLAEIQSQIAALGYRQLTTTSMGWAADFSDAVATRNRWPSLVTTYSP